MEGHKKLNLAQLSRLRVAFHTLSLFHLLELILRTAFARKNLPDSGNQPLSGCP